MVMFFNMLDVGGIAALLLWKNDNPHWNENRLNKRRLFLKDLAFELIKDQLHRRFENPRTLQKGVKLAFSALGFETLREQSPHLQESSQSTRQRCSVCPSRTTGDTLGDRKTKTCCQICGKPICKAHQCVTCFNCLHGDWCHDLLHEALFHAMKYFSESNICMLIEYLLLFPVNNGWLNALRKISSTNSRGYASSQEH